MARRPLHVSLHRRLADPDRAAVDQRLDTIAESIDQMTDGVTRVAAAIDQRLGAIIDAHNALDAKFRELHYRVLFVMQKIQVREDVRPGVIVTPGATPLVASLFEFWARDGDTFMADLRAMEEKLAAQFAHALDTSNAAPPADTPAAPPGAPSVPALGPRRPQ